MTQVATGVITIGSVLTFLITNYFTKWMLYWLTTGLAENPKKNYGIFGYKTKNNNTPVYVVDLNLDFLNVKRMLLLRKRRR